MVYRFILNHQLLLWSDQCSCWYKKQWRLNNRQYKSFMDYFISYCSSPLVACPFNSVVCSFLERHVNILMWLSSIIHLYMITDRAFAFAFLRVLLNILFCQNSVPSWDAANTPMLSFRYCFHKHLSFFCSFQHFSVCELFFSADFSISNSSCSFTLFSLSDDVSDPYSATLYTIAPLLFFSSDV